MRTSAVSLRAPFARRSFRRGPASQAVQSSVSWNPHRGTVRGLHFQWPPSREGKLVRCLRGRLRCPSGLASAIAKLSAARRLDAGRGQPRRGLHPAGRGPRLPDAAPHTEVLYQMSDFCAGTCRGRALERSGVLDILAGDAAPDDLRARCGLSGFRRRAFAAELRAVRRTAAGQGVVMARIREGSLGPGQPSGGRAAGDGACTSLPAAVSDLPQHHRCRST